MSVRRMAGRARSAVAARLARARDDERGISLLEVAIVLLVMAILMGMTVPIVSTLLQTDSGVNVTYSNVDSQIFLSTNLARLVRSAVAPDPSSSTAAPIPAFVPASISPTSMSFFTNVGNPTGPDEVSADCTATATTTWCAPTATFTVTLTTPRTCPVNQATLHTCQYTGAGTTTHVLIQIPHVRNGTNRQPLFVFSYAPPPAPGQPLQTTTVCATSTYTPTHTHPGCTTHTDAQVFSSCTLAAATTSLFNTCKAGEIVSVDYDLQINAKATGVYGGNQAEDDTGIFVMSATSMLYQAAVR